MSKATEFEELAQAMVYQREPRLRQEPTRAKPKQPSLPPVVATPVERPEPLPRFQAEETPAIRRKVVEPERPSVRSRLSWSGRSPSALIRAMCKQKGSYDQRPAPPEATAAQTEVAAEWAERQAWSDSVLLRPFPKGREGARPPSAGSSVFFLAVLGLVVIAVSVVALILAGPGSQWALLQG